MKKLIKSPNSIKTAYISAVKEELGLIKRKKTNNRKVKPPQYLKPFIKEAILNNPNATYKEIQEITLRLIRNSKESLPFYGVFAQFKTDNLEVNKDIYYE